MLELIVLGTIPGTQFTVTFFQSLLCLLSFTLVSTYLRESKKGLLEKQIEAEEKSI